MISRGSSSVPRATAANAPIPAASRPARSSTSTLTPESCARALRQRGRREHVRRPVLQVPRAVRGLGARHRGRRVQLVVRGEDQRLDPAGLRLLELAVGVRGEQRALDEPGDHARRSTWCGTSQHSVLVPSSFARPSTAAATTRASLGPEVLPPAEPGDDVAAAVRVRHGELAQPPFGLARIHQRLQPAAVVVLDPVVLEDADDDRVSVGGGGASVVAVTRIAIDSQHASNRDPEQRSHADRQARREVCPPSPPRIWAASPSARRWTARTSRPSRSSTS